MAPRVLVLEHNVERDRIVVHRHPQTECWRNNGAIPNIISLLFMRSLPDAIFYQLFQLGRLCHQPLPPPSGAGFFFCICVGGSLSFGGVRQPFSEQTVSFFGIAIFYGFET